jgi:hypothetical protein
MKNPFGIVVAVVFQSAFYLGMHQNNVFFLKKIIFDIGTSKQSENTKNKINLKQRKKIKKIQIFLKVLLKCKNKRAKKKKLTKKERKQR